MGLLLAKDELDINERLEALRGSASAACEIKTVDDFQRACRVKIKVARLIKAIEKACKPEKQKLYEAHKAAAAEEAALLEPAQAFDRNLTEAIVAFVSEREQQKQWLVESTDQDDMDAAAEALAMQVPKIDGISIGKRWRGVVTSLSELVYAVQNGDAPLEFLMINQKAVDEWANRVKSLDAGAAAFRATYDIVVKPTGKEKEKEHGHTGIH